MNRTEKFWDCMAKRYVKYLGLVLISACSSLQTSFQEPSVKLVNITPTASIGLEQRFDIDLRVTNPSAQALKLKGMNYVIQFEGFEVIHGGANHIPEVAAYGDALVTVQASVGLLESARLLARLLNKTTPDISYKIIASLDTGLPIIGMVPVSDSGVIDFSGAIAN